MYPQGTGKSPSQQQLCARGVIEHNRYGEGMLPGLSQNHRAWKTPPRSSSAAANPAPPAHHETINSGATSTHLLHTSRYGDPITSLRRLFQCPTPLLLKTFFLIPNLNLTFLGHSLSLDYRNEKGFHLPIILLYSRRVSVCCLGSRREYHSQAFFCLEG